MNEEELQYTKKSKEILIANCKDIISNIIKEDKFNPDTIIYKNNYYILKDNTQDTTVYYNADNNSILGLYIGFKK